MTWVVVVPTNRPDRIREFLAAWEPLFKQHHAVPILVEDAAEHFTVGHRAYCWQTIPDWIPRRTDMIRSWGFYQAWLLGSEYVLSLDDDVFPASDVFAEYERVFNIGAPCSTYLDVGSLTSYGLPLRGFPYKDRKHAEVGVQYGGWDGVLDYDACSQLAYPQGPHEFAPIDIAVPRGAAVTGCAMNMAFRTRYTPAMWQLPLYTGAHNTGLYNRFGDIWAGLFAKRTLDALGKAVVVNGRAKVRHDRASDPVTNLERETPGVRPNEDLWENLYCPTGKTLHGCYRGVTESAAWHFRKFDRGYGTHFLACRDKWLDLFK